MFSNQPAKEEKPLQFFGKLEHAQDEYVSLPLSVVLQMCKNLSSMPASSRRTELQANLERCVNHEQIETLLIADLNAYRIPQEIEEYAKSNGVKLVGKIDLSKS
jgi:hypothetical protein